MAITDTDEAINIYSLEMTRIAKQILIGDGYLTEDQWNEFFQKMLEQKAICPFS